MIAQIGKDMGLKLGGLNADTALDDPETVSMIIGETNFDDYGKYQALKVKLADMT